MLEVGHARSSINLLKNGHPRSSLECAGFGTNMFKNMLLAVSPLDLCDVEADPIEGNRRLIRKVKFPFLWLLMRS